MIAKIKQEGLLLTSICTQCTETLETKFISTMPKGIGFKNWVFGWTMWYCSTFSKIFQLVWFKTNDYSELAWDNITNKIILLLWLVRPHSFKPLWCLKIGSWLRVDSDRMRCFVSLRMIESKITHALNRMGRVRKIACVFTHAILTVLLNNVCFIYFFRRMRNSHAIIRNEKIATHPIWMHPNAIKTAWLSDEKEFNRTWKEKADNLWRGASKRKKKIRSTHAAWKRTEHYIGEAEGKKSNF